MQPALEHAYQKHIQTLNWIIDDLNIHLGAEKQQSLELRANNAELRADIARLQLLFATIQNIVVDRPGPGIHAC